MAGRGDRDRIDGIAADQLAGVIDLATEIVPADRGVDHGGDVAARYLSGEQGGAEPASGRIYR